MTQTDPCSRGGLERRLIVARALASEHGAPLGSHDEEDQLNWDRKACAVLRELDALSQDRYRAALERIIEIEGIGDDDGLVSPVVRIASEALEGPGA